MQKTSFTMDKKLQRQKGIDAVAGIMILNMVIGHCHSFPFQIYLSFFMPWFFFKSGMFYTHLTTKECVSKSAKKLLYPFVTFSLIGCFVHFIIIMLEGDNNWIHYTLTPLKEIVLSGTTCGNQPLWFLFSLFMVRVIYSIVENKIKHPIFIAIPAIMLATILNMYNNPLPDYVSNGSAGLAFFSMGYALRRKQHLISVSLISIVIYLLFAIYGITVVDMRGNSLQQGVYVLWFIIAVAGCVAFNSVFEKIPYEFKVLSWVGKNAMVIYVTHWMVIDIYYYVIQYFKLDGIQRIIGLFTTMVIAEYLLVQLFKYPIMQRLVKPSSTGV